MPRKGGASSNSCGGGARFHSGGVACRSDSGACRGGASESGRGLTQALAFCSRREADDLVRRERAQGCCAVSWTLTGGAKQAADFGLVHSSKTAEQVRRGSGEVAGKPTREDNLQQS